jgi:hypothetical protein
MKVYSVSVYWLIEWQKLLCIQNTYHNFIFDYFFCNLFIFKEKQRQIQIQKHMTCIYNLHRRNTFNWPKQTFCNITLKFQTPRTISNGNHFLHIYSLCVEDRKVMVVFSILMQYFRYFRPQLILGLSPKHLHLYK